MLDWGSRPRHDALLVEIRGLKNPRTYDPAGIPFHEDGQTIVKERFYLDKANPTFCTTKSPRSTMR